MSFVSLFSTFERCFASEKCNFSTNMMEVKYCSLSTIGTKTRDRFEAKNFIIQQKLSKTSNGKDGIPSPAP